MRKSLILTCSAMLMAMPTLAFAQEVTPTGPAGVHNNPKSNTDFGQPMSGTYEGRSSTYDKTVQPPMRSDSVGEPPVTGAAGNPR